MATPARKLVQENASASSRTLHWQSVTPLTEEKIHGFARMPPGWRYGRGGAAQSSVIDAALRLNSVARRATLETNAFLGPDREVQITVYHGAHYLEFTIADDGLVDYVREDGHQEISRTPQLTLDAALSQLNGFVDDIWRSSVSYTATTTTQHPAGNVFKTSLSRHPDAVLVFPSSSMTAQFESVEVSADT
jgi:hypothetical protein